MKATVVQFETQGPPDVMRHAGEVGYTARSRFRSERPGFCGFGFFDF